MHRQLLRLRQIRSTHHLPPQPPFVARALHNSTPTTTQQHREMPLVFLVHGMFGFQQQFHLLQSYLERHRINVLNWTYPSSRTSFEILAASLVEAVRSSCARLPVHSSQQIHFVTHSAGALVLRCALSTNSEFRDFLDGRQSTTHFVQIAPANGGSTIARFVRESLPEVVTQFLLDWFKDLESCPKPQYSALEQLMKYEQSFFLENWWDLPSNMQLHIISSSSISLPFHFIQRPNDGMLTVQEQIALPPHVKQLRQVVKVHGHHSLLLNYAKVSQTVLNILNGTTTPNPIISSNQTITPNTIVTPN